MTIEYWRVISEGNTRFFRSREAAHEWKQHRISTGAAAHMEKLRLSTVKDAPIVDEIDSLIFIDEEERRGAYAI